MAHREFVGKMEIAKWVIDDGKGHVVMMPRHTLGKPSSKPSNAPADVVPSGPQRTSNLLTFAQTPPTPILTHFPPPQSATQPDAMVTSAFPRDPIVKLPTMEPYFLGEDPPNRFKPY